MSSWYVFNAIGFYPYSPADPRYIVTVPLFQRTSFQLADHKILTILKRNAGDRITGITYGGQKLDGFFVEDSSLKAGKELVITTQ